MENIQQIINECEELKETDQENVLRIERSLSLMARGELKRKEGLK
jgi:hypothetical protein